MDFHTYYLRRIEAKADQKRAIQSCRDMAMKLFEVGPLTWSIESGAALLSALHEVQVKPGIDILPIYDEIENALLCELQEVRLDLQHDREDRVKSTGCGRPQKAQHCHRK